MPQGTAPTAPETAQAVAASMRARDALPAHLGIVVEVCQAGTARARLLVTPAMQNSHGTCHGGILFALADTAFAYACNSHNENAVAAHCSIDFLAPAQLGDTLTATAVERSRMGRTGIYDVDIVNQQGATLAVFRGRSHRIRGQAIAPAAENPDASSPSPFSS